MPPALSLSIRDAARATGLSVKALQRRIERGTLPAHIDKGIRRIPLRALTDAGLLVTRIPDGGVPPPEATTQERRLAAIEARLAEVERRLTDLDV